MWPGTSDITLQACRVTPYLTEAAGDDPAGASSFLPLLASAHEHSLFSQQISLSRKQFTDKIIKGFEMVTGNIKGSGVILSQALSPALAPCPDAGGGP